MGNVGSWVTGCMLPDEQVLWHAAHSGNDETLRTAIAKLTPQTRRYLEWQDPCSGRTPLSQAAKRGKLSCAVLLVAAGANCNAKDYKGNTPLHLACESGRIELVRYLVHVPNLVPFEVNLEMMTPLDVVRAKQDKDCERSKQKTIALEQCIEELEKTFYVYSGWLYYKTDSLLSLVSGISSLNTWKRRFAIVLQRGIPDVLEIALFSMRPGGTRPACPSTVVLYHVRNGMVETTDAKWFDRKDFPFTLTGSIRRDSSHDPRLATSVQPLEFAAMDAPGLQMWKEFFAYQQEMLASHRHHSLFSGAPHGGLPGLSPGLMAAQTQFSGIPAPPPPYAPAAPHAPPPYASAAPAPYDSVDCCDTTKLGSSVVESSRASAATTSASTVHDEDEYDEDLRRAIELSLLTAPPVSPPLPVASSAPAWGEDDDQAGAGSYSSSSSGEVTDARSTDANIAPVVSYSRAPSYPSIGECVVCFDGPQTAVCVPCGHNAVCMSCAEEILETTCECPVCRRPIRELIKLYRV